MVRQLSVLNIMAPPNLINSELVPPPICAHICCGTGLDMAEAKKTPLKTVRHVPLVVRFGTCMVQVDFVVCDKLGPPVIVCCDFCDRFVEPLRPRAKNVEHGNLLQYQISGNH